MVAMNLCEVLEQRAVERPEQWAIVEPGRRGRRITYRELHRRIAAKAGGFRKAGLRPGDRVLILRPISIDLYVDLLGLIYAGMVAVLIDPGRTNAFVSQCLQRTKPKCMTGSGKSRVWRLVRKAWRGLPWLSASAVPDLRGCEPVESDAPALITFTSGSTAQPKGIVRTHGLLLAQQKALVHALQYEAGERDLVTLPVFVLANLASGLTSVIADADLRFPARSDSKKVHRQIESERIERITAAPAFLEALMSKECHWPSLRKIYTGGAPVFPDLKQRLAKRFHDVPLITVVYGSTEAEPIAHLSAAEWTSAMDFAIRSGGGLPVGKPVREVDVIILPNQWGQPIRGFLDSLVPESPGEIVVCGEHVVRGYLDGVGDDETKIHAGGRVWHRTGDVGYLDKDGVLWLLGRASEAVRVGGEAIYPLAVEAALTFSIGKIKSAFLEYEGRRLLVIDQAVSALFPESMLDSLIGGDLAWAKIDELILMNAIPMDRRHQSKIDYPKLRERLDSR